MILLEAPSREPEAPGAGLEKEALTRVLMRRGLCSLCMFDAYGVCMKCDETGDVEGPSSLGLFMAIAHAF